MKGDGFVDASGHSCRIVSSGACLLGKPTGGAEFDRVRVVDKLVSMCLIGVRLVASCWFEYNI